MSAGLSTLQTNDNIKGATGHKNFYVLFFWLKLYKHGGMPSQTMQPELTFNIVKQFTKLNITDNTTALKWLTGEITLKNVASTNTIKMLSGGDRETEFYCAIGIKFFWYLCCFCGFKVPLQMITLKIKTR